MEKIIKLHSRSGNNNYLELINGKTYALKTTYPYIRVGHTPVKNGNKDFAMFVDPSGGPMIVAGEVLEEAKAKVKSIDFVKGVGYTITFE
jgi:hypothetical protein